MKKEQYVFSPWADTYTNYLDRQATVSTPSATPTPSDDGSADEGATIHCESPAVARGELAASPSIRKG